MMAVDDDALALLVQTVPSVVRASITQLKEKKLKTRAAVLSMLRELVLVLPRLSLLLPLLSREI